MDVGQVVLHRNSGVAALQWVPSRLSEINDGVPIDALSAADALAAKQLMRSTLLSISETIHASPAGMPPIAPLHTALAFWALLPGGCAARRPHAAPSPRAHSRVPHVGSHRAGAARLRIATSTCPRIPACTQGAVQ